MKSLSIMLWLVLSSNSISQTFQWSQPILMCDSIANNINPTFIHSWDNMIDYNVMVWERDYGDSSKILYKKFSQPDSEFVLISSLPNFKVSNPKISLSNLLVWQDNKNNNNDIYSAIIAGNELTNMQQVTTSNLNDVKPDLFENLLVWERNGNILFTEYNYHDSTWSQEIMLDSIGCENPVTNYWQIAYQKQNGDSSEIYLIENQQSVWQTPVKISYNSDNINPTFSFGIFYNLLWQQQIYTDWQIMAVSSYNILDTISINFSQYNEINPAAFGIPLITKDSDLDYMFLAFQTDSTGNQEIFVNNNMWAMLPANISNYHSEDRMPVFSAGGWGETGFNMVRVWLVWQSWRKNHWQLWGSYNDVIIAGIEEESNNHPTHYKLYKNYPNPFNSQTNIKYYLPKAGNVKIEIFDVLGQKVKTLINQNKNRGEHQVNWNGRDENNFNISSGVYIYNLTSGKYSTSKKLLVLK